MACGWNLYRGSYYPSHVGNHVATDLEVIAMPTETRVDQAFPLSRSYRR